MTADSAKPKRPRRSRYDALVEEIRAEEEAWKAEQEAARIAAGKPEPPKLPKWSVWDIPIYWGGHRRRH